MTYIKENPIQGDFSCEDKDIETRHCGIVNPLEKDKAS